jgi:hypothetical protein
MHTRCRHCQATLKLKSSQAVGKSVTCPKCRQPFVVRAMSDQGAAEPTPEPDVSEAASETPQLPPIVRTRKRKAGSSIKKGKRKAPAPPEKRFPVGALFSAAVWWNAHLAVAVCVIDNAIDFLWILAHWNEVYEQAGLGRFAVRRLGRPLFIIASAVFVWFHTVLPRDIGSRAAAAVFGGGYLFLFGLVAWLIGLLAQSVYERPVYAIQWSVVYLGASLVAYSLWGFGPETALRRAERLMAAGRFEEALTAVNHALEEAPDDEDAYELERTLRDMLRWG